jgi:hypothetical protein
MELVRRGIEPDVMQLPWTPEEADAHDVLTGHIAANSI